jgi:hypothetical protein
MACNRFTKIQPPRSASGSDSHKYESGSVSFHHQAKIERKTLISTALSLLYDLISLKNDANVPGTSVPDPQPDLLARGTDPRIRIPDPYQNVMDPHHWLHPFCYSFQACQ